MTMKKRAILVTGGGTLLADSIAAALLAEGAETTLLVRAGAEERLGPLAERLRWQTADVWNPASLKGRARNHASVIHTVGSMAVNMERGLNFNWLNTVSARNVANMCVGDGVSRLILMSGVRAPWVSGAYVRSKREAEHYDARVGLHPVAIRAPVTYVPAQQRPLIFQLMTILGIVPPLSWTTLGRIAPMPIDVLARAVARIVLEIDRAKPVYYGPDLRKRGRPPSAAALAPYQQQKHDHESLAQEIGIDEDVPFGWTPPGDA